MHIKPNLKILPEQQKEVFPRLRECSEVLKKAASEVTRIEWKKPK